MAKQKTFFQRMGHHGLCVLLYDMVDAERANTSDSFKEDDDLGADGLCYASLTTIRFIGEDEYIVRVSPTPESLCLYTVLLTEDQLRYCLAFDARVIGKSPVAIRAAICAHAREIQPVRALPVEPGHFLEQIRTLPEGSIAGETGAFKPVTLRLAADPADCASVQDNVPVVDFPLTAQDVNEAIEPFKKIGRDLSHPRIHALPKWLHFDIVLKAIDNRRKRLMESWQAEFAEALAHLGEARERIKLLLVAQANTNAHQPVIRADVYGLKRKGGLGKRGRGVFIIEKALISPLAA